MADVKTPMTTPIPSGNIRLLEVGFALKGQKLEVQDQSCTVHNEGACVAQDDQVLGIAFEDGTFLTSPGTFSHRIQYYYDYPVEHGLLAYRGRIYQIQNGEIYDSTFQSMGFIQVDGTFSLLLSNKLGISGNIEDFFGISAALYMEGFPIYDSFPETGTVALPHTSSFEVQDAQLWQSGKIHAGTINSRGEISWKDGYETDLKKEPSCHAQLTDDRRGDVFMLDREKDKVQRALQHIPVLQRIENVNSRQNITWEAYTLIYTGGMSMLAQVKIHPFFSSETPKDIQAIILTTINDSVRTRLENQFQLSPQNGNPPYQLRFEVQFVLGVSDGEMLFYQDTNKKFQNMNGTTPTLNQHTVRPTTHQISIDNVSFRFPHEFLHYLGADDEYPNANDPNRKVTDRSSIMYHDFGSIKPWHLDGLAQSASVFLNQGLTVTPVISSNSQVSR